MRTAHLLSEATKTLESAHFPSAHADAKILLAHCLGTSVPNLVFTETVSTETAATYSELIKRRLAGSPVQHLTGVAWFRTVELQVGPGVFVPRPETETLVQLGLDWLVTQHLDAPVVVDLGTGSGAIAAAIHAECPTARVFATEIDPAALRFARANLPAAVTLSNADLELAFPELSGQADLVISNPPYVPAHSHLPIDVADHDPNLALFGGTDGLDVVRKLLPAAARLLRAGGLLVFEHDETQSELVVDLLERNGAWSGAADHVDLCQRPRYARAERTQ